MIAGVAGPAGPGVGGVADAGSGSRVAVARAVAEQLLGEFGDRWRHTLAVAARAEELGITVEPPDRDVLLVAAWLHDIGYSPTVRDSDFHPLDGAAYLRRHGWPSRICGLVAHHSGAAYVAAAHGFSHTLSGYPREESAVSDALTYADQTIGPQGQPVTIEQRQAEKLARHGPDSAQARVNHLRGPYLLAVAERVETRPSRLTTPH